MVYTDIDDNFNIVTKDVAVENSIKNIIQTPIGSVPGHPEFGSNLN